MSEILIDPRILAIEAQIAACERGATNVINCPYCKAQVKADDEALCCSDMGLTVRAILRKKAQEECLHNAEAIMEAVAKN